MKGNRHSFNFSVRDIILSVGFLVWVSVGKKRPRWEACAKAMLLKVMGKKGGQERALCPTTPFKGKPTAS